MMQFLFREDLCMTSVLFRNYFFEIALFLLAELVFCNALRVDVSCTHPELIFRLKELSTYLAAMSFSIGFNFLQALCCFCLKSSFDLVN